MHRQPGKGKHPLWEALADQGMVMTRATVEGSEERRLIQKGEAPRRTTQIDTKEAAADIRPITAPSSAT